MEENKVATDKELRERADRIASTYGDDMRVIRDLAESIFREMVAVRNATIKDVLRYEADVAAYGTYCAERGDKP